MAAVDTSVCVPALTAWHEHHDLCRRAAAGARAPAHVLLEAYSVLTRLPPPHRLNADVAHDVLRRWFPPAAVLTVGAGLQREAIDRLHDAGIEGGGVYDGLVALTASAHGERLVTRDRRAVRTYEALGVEFDLLEP